jgi:hypothetical protein
MKVADASLDDFHSAAGKLLQNAATNELFLAKAFEIILETSALIAHRVFYSFDSLEGKANLVRRVADVSGNETDRSYIDRIIDAAKKSNKQRNLVAHSLLVFDAPDLKSGMRSISLKAQKYDSISKASLAAMVATSSKAISEGHAALEEFCSGRGVSPLLDVRYLDP